MIERFFSSYYLPVMTSTKHGIPVAAWASVLLFLPLLAAAGPSGDWCGFSLPGQKRHHGGRVAAAPLEAATP